MQASEVLIGIKNSLPFYSKSVCVFVYVCVYVGGVCISIFAADEVLNYKRSDMVALFARVLSGCLGFMANHKATNPSMQ